jgi:motility quorum-sensing regulator/GCU-specific mRNA interferase toxin
VEKRRPTYDLDAIKAAIDSALSLGFNRSGIVAVIQSIQRPMFYKSMTTLADHRTWQDVYHVPADGLVLYVKFQADVLTEFRVMSFKEK